MSHCHRHQAKVNRNLFQAHNVLSPAHQTVLRGVMFR